VDVVEQKDQRSFLRKSLEQSAHRPVAAVSLVDSGRRRTGRETRERRENPGQLANPLIVEALQEARFKSLQVLVERIHEQRKGEILLELRRRPRQHQVTAPLGTRHQVSEKTRLSYSGLPGECGGACETTSALIEQRLKGADFFGTAHQIVNGNHRNPSHLLARGSVLEGETT
jgi:hypothetical protein